LTGEVLEPFKKEILDAVTPCKYDKVKSVHDMATTTLNALNNLKDVPQRRLSSLTRDLEKQKDPYGTYIHFNIS